MAESEGTMTISERLSTIRERKGLTRVQLAEKAGISFQSLYKYETGKIDNLTLTSLMGLCDALNVSPLDLIGSTRLPVYEKPCEIRVYDKISGVAPSPLTDDVAGYISYPLEDVKSADDVFAVNLCRGFVEPPLADGEKDVLIIRRHGKSDRIESDGLYAVTLDEGGLAIGKIEASMEGLRFVQVCPGETETSYSWQEVNEEKIRIIGKCMETRRILC